MLADDRLGRPGSENYCQRPSHPSVLVRLQKDGKVPSRPVLSDVGQTGRLTTLVNATTPQGSMEPPQCLVL